MHFHAYCLAGDIKSVRRCLDEGYDFAFLYEWEAALQNACEGGNIEIVELIINKGAHDWDMALFCACRGGHVPVIDLLITKGASQWNWGLRGACHAKRLDIIKMMILKGANNLIWSFLQFKSTQFELLSHGVTRDQLRSIPNIQSFFTELDVLNDMIKQELSAVISVTALIPLCMQYACL